MGHDSTQQHVQIVAELSGNHQGSFERACQLVRAAAQAGADAVKIQTYTPESMTIPCKNEYFCIQSPPWAGCSLYELYTQAQTPWDWTPGLMALAKELGIDCFSTPFDEKSVDFLEKYGVSRYKIASFEIVDIPLLKKVATCAKPVLLSTGMANLAEIDEAVRCLRENGAGELTLLKCTSSYPAAPEDANLRYIPHLAQSFACQAGLSDHSLGSTVAVAATALGATVIEKHLTLARSDGGPDCSFSMEPEEFANMVREIRTVENALGHVSYTLSPNEATNRTLRRSLFVVKDIKAGEIFDSENVRSIRPGHGLHPRFLGDILGKTCPRDLCAGTPLAWDLLQ